MSSVQRSEVGYDEEGFERCTRGLHVRTGLDRKGRDWWDVRDEKRLMGPIKDLMMLHVLWRCYEVSRDSPADLQLATYFDQVSLLINSHGTHPLVQERRRQYLAAFTAQHPLAVQKNSELRYRQAGRKGLIAEYVPFPETHVELIHYSMPRLKSMMITMLLAFRVPTMTMRHPTSPLCCAFRAKGMYTYPG